MIISIQQHATLVPFAATHAAAVQRLEARVGHVNLGTLAFSFLAEGSIAALVIPSSRSPNRADRLWEHTCFEAFIRADDDPAYYEFNFSPAGEWAAYSFRGYRDGGPLQDESCSPEIVVRRTADKLELNAVVHLDHFLAIRHGSPFRIGLSAVIEASDGTLSYWALKHPAAKPDFHHPDSFALDLALPSQPA